MIGKRRFWTLSGVLAAIWAAGIFPVGQLYMVTASALGRFPSKTIFSSAAPSLTVSTPAGIMYDRIAIHYTLQNSPAASFDVKVEYSTNGPAGSYATATEALGSPSEGTKGMTASEAGTSHIFVWNSFYDLNREEVYHADVILRMNAVDRMTGVTMGSAQTASFKVDNTVVALALGQSGAGIPSVGDGGPATGAQIFLPRHLALAGEGSILLAEFGGARVRQFTVGGKIETIMGNGIPVNVSPTIPVPATGSVLRQARGVCVDANGVVLVTVQGPASVLATNPVTGSIVRVAGGGTGPDGIALSASLTAVQACIALPPVPGRPHVVLVSDAHRIRRFQYAYDNTTGNIDPATAKIDTICGTATAGFSPDGTPALSARLSTPIGLTYDPSSKKLFVADSNNNIIRAIDLPDPNGIPGPINTVAGNGTAGFLGDAGPATAAQLAGPTSVALDPATGAIYIGDGQNNRVRQFTIGGMINTVAGDGGTGVAGIDGPALQANVSFPQGLVVAKDGSVLVSANGTNQVLALTPEGRLTTVAGAPPSSLPGEGGQANQSPITGPPQCTVSGDILYVTDSNARYFRKVDLRTGIVTRVAGSGVSGGAVTDGMSALDAPLGPVSIAADDQGNLYVPARASNQILKIDSQGKITRFAGTGASGNAGDGGLALQATLAAPVHIAFSKVSGALYIAATGGRIRRVDRDGIITTVGGNGASNDEGAPATQANFQLSSLAIDPGTETIYVADVRHRILKFPVGGNVTYLAGVLNTPGVTADGAAAREARIRTPSGIAVDGRGNVFFSEIGNLRVRWIDADGILRTVAGTGQAGLITEGSDPTRCDFFFNSAGSIGLDSQGNIYFPDIFYVVRFRPPY